jgi:hypothetical protein
MTAARREAKVVDLQEYRRQRAPAERAPAATAPLAAPPMAWTFAWVPMMMVYPIWRLG